MNRETKAKTKPNQPNLVAGGQVGTSSAGQCAQAQQSSAAIETALKIFSKGSRFTAPGFSDVGVPVEWKAAETSIHTQSVPKSNVSQSHTPSIPTPCAQGPQF